MNSRLSCRRLSSVFGAVHTDAIPDDRLYPGTVIRRWSGNFGKHSERAGRREPSARSFDHDM